MVDSGATIGELGMIIAVFLAARLDATSQIPIAIANSSVPELCPERVDR